MPRTPETLAPPLILTDYNIIHDLYSAVAPYSHSFRGAGGQFRTDVGRELERWRCSAEGTSAERRSSERNLWWSWRRSQWPRAAAWRDVAAQTLRHKHGANLFFGTNTLQRIEQTWPFCQSIMLIYCSHFFYKSQLKLYYKTNKKVSKANKSRTLLQ